MALQLEFDLEDLLLEDGITVLDFENIFEVEVAGGVLGAGVAEEAHRKAARSLSMRVSASPRLSLRVSASPRLGGEVTAFPRLGGVVRGGR